MKFDFIIRSVTIIILFGLVFSLGYISNDLCKALNNDQQCEGLWIKGYDKKNALAVASSYDINGDWVCVNVNGMEYDRAVEVCQHEVGHEIFAEVCEKNMTKCLGIMNNG